MSLALVRVSILASAFLLITGCGGNSSSGNATNGSGGNSPATVTFTIVGGVPSALATKIGSGPFTAATLTSGKLTLSLPSDTTPFAVAYACPPESLPPSTTTPISLTEEHVFEATALDGTSFDGSCPGIALPSAGPTGILTGSVDASAIPEAGVVEIYAQGPANPTPVFPHVLPNLTDSFSLSAPAGNDRVMVLVYAPAGPGGNQAATSLVATKNFNSQAVPGSLNGGATIVLGAADQTTTAPLTYQNVPPGYTAPTTLVGYQIAGNGSISIAGLATSTYPVVPAGAAEMGDSYSFLAHASSTSQPSQAIAVRTTLPTAGPASIAFPPAWPYAGPTPAPLPSFDLSYTGFPATSVYREVGLIWLVDDTAENLVSVTATQNYLNGSTTVVIPDLTGLAGFLASPASGANVTWNAAILQRGVSSVSSSSGTIATVSNSGTYSVP